MRCSNFFDVWEKAPEKIRKICKECESPILARGLCIKHYARVRYRGLEPRPIPHAKRCRNLAREAGKKYYNTGVRCANGHDSNRMVSTGRCVKCAKQIAKNFLLIHPERRKETKERHRVKRSHNMKLWATHVIGTIRARSRKQKIPFNLTPEDIISVIPKDRQCPALGIPLNWGSRGGMSRNSPSIDRIVPSLGYIAGNIAIISHKANSMKQDAVDSNELRLLANWMDAPLAYTKL
jgi:hypothetical protein